MIRLVTVSGPPSSGKTSVILKTIDCLKAKSFSAGVVKFDCMSSHDERLYEKAGIPAKTGLSGNLCPDHFYISNVDECLTWGVSSGLDFLIIESAGLCNRCSPHIKDILSVCVIDSLSGVNTPQKIGPMLKLADIVVITKGDIISQAEREIFIFRVKQANPKAMIQDAQTVSQVRALMNSLSCLRPPPGKALLPGNVSDFLCLRLFAPIVWGR